MSDIIDDKVIRTQQAEIEQLRAERDYWKQECSDYTTIEKLQERIAELERERDAARLEAEAVGENADATLAENVRYREALEKIAEGRERAEIERQIAREALDDQRRS